MFPSEIVVVPVIFGLLAAVVMMRMRLKHREYMASLPRPMDASEHDGRLARLESAMEAISVEIERIGEGQRFMTRVLAERSPESVAVIADSRQSDTPH